MNKISIIIPVYYNENTLEELYNDLKTKLFSNGKFEYEIIMVDDGSGDNSWCVMSKIAISDPCLKIIKLSRNFGSHAAILCGLLHSSGDCAVVKAADLQEPTELIFDMYESWKQGNNVVLAARKSREDKSIFSNLYYRIVKKAVLPSMPKNGFDVYLVDKKVIKVLEIMDEKDSALTCQILWSGFKTGIVYYDRKERKKGKSRWTIKKKMRLVFDTLFSFSSLPITIITWVGMLSCIGSVGWAIYVLIAKIIGTIQTAGYATLFIFELLSFGIIMMTLGILGNYLWRSFDASRGRPVYIIEDEFHLSENRENDNK